ncbi:MAG: restriction endonuclease subunit R [Micavibrio sp.]|nr:restriction endonuclease subunit R [Micavibrio sp.]|tara:strand:- start:79337 stop:81658 length:2322 start_codon:yes stop_codon:yes gene_type:complete
MNEAETRAELIDPAIKAAGWGVVENSRVGREVITLGRLQGAGQRAKQDIADYVLIYKGHKLGVVEAKARDKSDTEGVQQAKRYATMLSARYAFSTNGLRIYQIDMQTGEETYIDRYPTPEELWNLTFGDVNEWRERFGAIPFETGGGKWQPRYYQHNAITKTLEAVAHGKDRILLTLATGTGKTGIAFQLAWKLFHSKWNISRAPSRRPRILFLADRNILANQAYNSFAAFSEDARARIKPSEIKKTGRVPKNASIFFTIFQTFMSGTDENGDPAPYFGEYPSDFFDFIIIDECHRGGANDESNWRQILEHFAPAVQLGLTATPKRKDNVDTYAYFGNPVYSYSLKEGINDGFLTPFKVRQIASTIDEYVYTSDDDVERGEIEEGKRYTEGDFNKKIVIDEREKFRVKTFMSAINQNEKTIVFCATQDHAAAVRNYINQIKKSTHPDYCVRVTANDGSEGERFLELFQDNEKTIPTILTTSQKLSTGVDAPEVRNIVLMRPVNSMIEFKQIVGRGTRLFENKDYFTIFDFVKAYEHFNDPEWDGEPVDPTPVQTKPPKGDDDEEGEGENGGDTTGGPEPEPRPEKIVVKLADGKERTIQHMSATMFYSPDGKPMSAAEFVQRLFGELPVFFNDEDELRKIWGVPETRKALLESLSEKGYGSEQLAEIGMMINAEQSDLYDVLAYIAFKLGPISRRERVEARKDIILSHYDDRLQGFIEFVLTQYVQEGVGELDRDKLPHLLELKYQAVADAAKELGGVTKISDAFVGFQKDLY